MRNLSDFLDVVAVGLLLAALVGLLWGKGATPPEKKPGSPRL